MPLFNPSPFLRPPLALPGRPIFVFGTFVDTISPTRFAIRQILAVGDDALATGTITEGPIPEEGQRITILGLKDARLNVTDARIQDVDINEKSGSGTITYELQDYVLLTLSNQAAIAIIPRLPKEEIVDVDEASMSVCLPDSPEGKSVQGFSAEVGWPDDAIGGKVEVQVADINRESSFHTLDTIEFPKTRYDTPAGVSANFVRLMVTEVSGDGSITGRILVR